MSFFQCVDERRIQLERGFAAGEYHKRDAINCAPEVGNAIGKLFSGCKLAAAGAVGADKIGVAELADRAFSMNLAARPEIAAGESVTG
jgi:hypothetical protein